MADNEKIKSGIVWLEAVDNIGIASIHNGIQNKISQPDFMDLEFFKEWIYRQKLKGLIITGQGRHFSAGADIDTIKANKHNTDYLKDALKKGKEILSYIETLPIVTVAAVSGVCFGAGLEIALSCQFRIGTENSVLALPEANIGIMPGLAGTIRLPRIIGKSKAIQMIISGRTINAEEAFGMGLLDKVVPAKMHLSSAKQYIEELVQNKSHQQINSIIQSVNNSITEINETAMNTEGNMFAKLVEEGEI